MDLILWRHAEAEAGGPDSARKLTEHGQEQARRIAAWLKPRLPGNCEILVSPAARAQQTVQALGVAFMTTPAGGTDAAAADVASARERCGGSGIRAARPGCSPRSTPSLRELLPLGARAASKPVVQTCRDDGRRTAIGVVAWI
ncbi:MAG: hypothetical protein E6H51_02120 [Betaproteobacteria bacterium]|nr:MAG: hypothetical protein E6H51_02120 [Betaproteobacteria bacterium]